MADLLINGRDAFITWGVRMGKGFIDSIDAPVPLKPFIENKSRLEDGKRIIVSNIKKDERDLTLTFTITGKNESDYKSKKDAFFQELYKGTIDIQIPQNSSDIYHLNYTGKNIKFAQNKSRTFCCVSCKFCEPNPANRV